MNNSIDKKYLLLQIEQDHDELDALLSKSTRCQHDRPAHASCDYNACHTGAQCATSILESLHQYLAFTVDHFQHEESLMKTFVSETHYKKHVERHAEIAAILSETVKRFTQEKNLLSSVAGITSLRNLLQEHVLTTDAEMFEFLSPLNQDSEAIQILTPA